MSRQNDSQHLQRPNIVVCIADDLSALHIGAMGYKGVRTPNMDRVAREGVVFEQGYCSAPSCAPSRAALLSGQDFCRLEEGANLLGSFPAKFSVYPDILERERNYAAGLTRKGWGPGNVPASSRTRNPAGVTFPNIETFLDSRKKAQPFAYWFGSNNPHRPYEAGNGANSGVDVARLVLPPHLPDVSPVRNDFADYIGEVEAFDREVGEILSALDVRGLADNTILVVTSDNGMPFPRAKMTGYDWGTRVPLLIRWPQRVRPNRRVTDFVSQIDLAPTFLEAAHLPVPKEMTGRSLMGILTGGRSGRVERRRDRVYFGRERHDIHRTETGRLQPVGYPIRGVRTDDFLYLRNYKPERLATEDKQGPSDLDDGPTKAYFREHRDDPDFKATYDRIFARRPAEELYDLKTNPNQFVSVAELSRYSSKLREIRGDMERWQARVGDPRRPGGTDPDIFDRYPWYPNKPKPAADATKKEQPKP